jgi:hypothetical protein
MVLSRASLKFPKVTTIRGRLGDDFPEDCGAFVVWHRRLMRTGDVPDSGFYVGYGADVDDE